MPPAKILQSLWNLRQKLDWMVQHHAGKTNDLRMQVRRNRIHTEPLKRSHQRMRKTMLSVTMLHHALPLHIVENFAYLLGRKLMMIQKRNEAGNGTFEVDVVFPQRIVS